MTIQDAPAIEAALPAGGFTPPREGQIFTLMSQVMANVKGIAKSHRNQEQNYAFRSIDDAYNVVQPALVEAGVFCTPRVLGFEAKPVTSRSGNEGTHILMRVAFEWCAPDGSSVTTIMLGQAIDYSDKAANKAMSAAYKYAMLETLCIPVAEGGEDREGDYHTPEATAGPPAPAAPVVGGACPKCGKPMRKRSRKDGKGEFMGCTGYPACKHTEKVPDDLKPPADAPAKTPKFDKELAQEVAGLSHQLTGLGPADASRRCFEIASEVLGRNITAATDFENNEELAKVRDALVERLDEASANEVDDVLPY